MNAYATILEKGRGWVTIAHHPGGIDTVIGRFTAKYQAKACADTFNNAAARAADIDYWCGDDAERAAEVCPTCGRDTSRSEGWSTGQCDDCYLDDRHGPAVTDVDLDDPDVYAAEVAVHGDIVVELVAAVERHSNMLADLVRLVDKLERRVAALEHPEPVH